MLNVLFLYKYRVPMEQSLDYKLSFINMLSTMCNLKCYGPGFDGYDDQITDVQVIINKLYNNSQPDIIFYMYLNNGGTIFTNFNNINCKKILLRIDPHIDGFNNYIKHNYFDIFLHDMTPNFFPIRFPYPEKCILFPRSVDLNSCIDYISIEHKKYDICLAGAMGPRYPLRLSMLKDLIDEKHKHIKTLILPGRQLNDSSEQYGYLNYRKQYNNEILNVNSRVGFNIDLQQMIMGKPYFDILSNSKMVAFCSSKWKYPLFKIFEVMSCKSAAVFDRPNNAEEYGLISDVNYIDVNEHNFIEKVTYYLKHQNELTDIIKNAYELVKNRHSYYMRCKDLICIMETLLE